MIGSRAWVCRSSSFAVVFSLTSRGDGGGTVRSRFQASQFQDGDQTACSGIKGVATEPVPKTLVEMSGLVTQPKHLDPSWDMHPG